MRSPNIPVDKHVLNFEGEVSIPEGMFQDGNPLSLMVGAGDLDHGGVPNVQTFHQYDVFFCNGWDWNGSLLRNVEYLRENFANQKLICIVDYSKKEQLAQFIKMFSGRFSLIDGHGGHTPHFKIGELRNLLCEGGEAMNIYERSESLISAEDIVQWFETGNARIPWSSYVFLTSRIYNLPLDKEEEIKQRFLHKIETLLRSLNRITVAEEILNNLPRFSLSELQDITVSLMFDDQIHLDMMGEIRMNTRLWRKHPYLEIIIKKVPIDFKEEKIALCTDLELKARAEFIISKIKEELLSDIVYGPCAKYRTLLKHIRSDKFELACRPNV